MVVAAINRASNPFMFENKNAKSNSDRWRDWEYVLGATCALVKRYYHDYKKEEFAVELETERRDRDYLYGRLLAVADEIESSARYKQGKTKKMIGLQMRYAICPHFRSTRFVHGICYLRSSLIHIYSNSTEQVGI